MYEKRKIRCYNKQIIETTIVISYNKSYSYIHMYYCILQRNVIRAKDSHGNSMDNALFTKIISLRVYGFEGNIQWVGGDTSYTIPWWSGTTRLVISRIT